MPAGIDRATASTALLEVRLPPAPPGYDFIRELVGGGMSIVYLAHELAADRTVAMKFLRGFASSSAVERFTVELRVLAALKHPNIVRVLAQDFLRADPFFTMEFEPGGTLAELVKARDPLSSNEAATLIRAVASAIQAAHAKGILHRDIKPSNVLLAADGTPKVSDFGLAKRTDKDDGITTASGAIGTPSYMPPEQISRKWGEITAASDVYSIGATLYHLLTGMPPFRGDSNVETMRLVESEPPKRPRAMRPEIPLALEAIVMKCLEKKPADRYPTAEALVASLDRFLAGEEDPESPQLTRWRRVKKWVGRNRRNLATGGVVMLIATGLIWAEMTAALFPTRANDDDKDPLAVIQNELKNTGHSTLIGGSAPPRYLRGLIGRYTLLQPTDHDPAFAIEAPDPTQLELLRNPGVDSFRLTADIRLRYLKAIVTNGGVKTSIGSGDTALIGFYVGDVELGTADGHPVHICMAVSYSDFMNKEAQQTLKIDKAAVQLRTSAIAASADGIQEATIASAGKPILFNFADDLPAPWRRFRLDLTPGGARVFWADSLKADWQLLGELSASQIAEHLNRKCNELGVKLAAHQPLTWNPGASVGIWCRQAAMSVKNVVIDILPNP